MNDRNQQLDIHSVLRKLRSSPEKLDGLTDQAAETIEAMLSMLEQFAMRGEALWDLENFRLGYKKVPSGDFVDCRKLIGFVPCDNCGSSMRPDINNVVLKCQACDYILASG